MNEIILTLLPLLLLLAASAFFSGSETACTSLSKLELRKLRKEKDPSFLPLLRLMKDTNRLLTTILIGNNLVNNWASSLATAAAIAVLGEGGIGAATAGMTVLIILFGELGPKSFASKRPIAVSKTVAPILLVLVRLFWPLATLFTGINRFFISILPHLSAEHSHLITEDEIKTVMDLGRKEGVLEEKEHKLLNRAWEFTDIRIREIMIPRTAMAAIPENSSITEARSAFRTQGFSRMPVFSKSLDTITGILHYREILLPSPNDSKAVVSNLVQSIHFVSELQTASGLLAEFRSNGHHLAIVLDEHGTTAGLVTRRAAIAAVLGGIHDEFDIASPLRGTGVQIIDPRYVRIPGSIKLDDLNTILGTSFDSEYYETAGGYLLEKAGKLPSFGERIPVDGALFIVEERSGRKITRIGVLLENKE